MKPDAKLGARMRKLRRISGLSLREVARRMGISAPHLCDLEHDRRNWLPRLVNACRRALSR